MSTENNMRLMTSLTITFKVNTVNDDHYQPSVGGNSTEGMRRNDLPKAREQSAYRFISLTGSESVRGHCVSDAGQTTVVKTVIGM